MPMMAHLRFCAFILSDQKRYQAMASLKSGWRSAEVVYDGY